MNRKSGVTVLLVTFLCIFFQGFAGAVTVFSDNFSSGGFSSWSETSIGPGATQAVTDGVARFIVPTPGREPCTYSFVKRAGFTSTVNSTMIVTQDIYVTKIPNGSPQGNGAIFFLYLCDSTDLSGKRGNFGVGIDGSQVWSLWLGSNVVYTYVFQTAGSAPVSNTWYRLVLTVDNPSGTAVLSVNGSVVISVDQHEFTDGTHPITLMSGMGEDWWSGGNGLQEIDIDNVSVYISDMVTPIPTPTPSPSTTPTSTPIPTPELPNSTPAPTQTTNTQPTPAPTHTPNRTTNPPEPNPPTPTKTPMPSSTPNNTPTPMQETASVNPVWMVITLTILVAVGIAVAVLIKNR